MNIRFIDFSHWSIDIRLSLVGWIFFGGWGLVFIACIWTALERFVWWLFLKYFSIDV